MKYVLCVILPLITCCLLVTASKNKNENSNDEEDSFVPTREWQVVKKGQKIPKGLHIRVNFETGLTEAKLLEENENEKTSAVAEIPNTNGNEAGVSNGEFAGSLKFLEEELKEALKNIKDDYNSEDGGEMKIKQFKSYEELKKELDSLGLTPKTDAELIRELLEKHKSDIEEPFILTIIADLEYLVHQYDNANEFVALNGFKEIIFKNLNSSNADIKRETLKLLGAAVQNNAKVQIHALEMGTIGILIKQFALDSDYSIKNRAIFALSGILRHFPLAQLKFIQDAGLNIFEEELTKQKHNIKIQLKIITLVNDLLLEHKYVLEDNSSANHEQKLQQYNQVNLKKKLEKHNWCNYVNNLFQNIFKIDINDFDSIEKCLNAVSSIVDICDADTAASVKATTLKLQSHFKNLILNDIEDDDEDGQQSSFNYYAQLLALCKHIIYSLNNMFKSEL